MKTRKINFLVILIMVVLLLGCSSGDDNGITPKAKPDIFIVGEADGKATLWKNGEIIEQKERSSFKSVFVFGNDVYIGGGDFISGDYYARLWKNGAKMNIQGATNRSEIESIYVDGDQVYAVGFEENSSGDTEAKVWKNGVVNTIGNGGYGIGTESAESLFVHNNDVYVVTNDESSYLWKNNSNILTLDTGFFDSVFVIDNDVYLAGDTRNDDNIRVATVWKNGEPQELSDKTTSAKKVFVHNNDVYVVGHESSYISKPKAKLWKNGVNQNITLESEGSYATDVFVYNDNVYVIGHQIEKDTNKLIATLWINGEPQRLTTNTSERSRAQSIYIR